MLTRLETTRRYAPHSRRKGVFALISLFRSIWSERKTLADLDGTLLKDIGVTKNEAQREAMRRAWDAPERWMR